MTTFPRSTGHCFSHNIPKSIVMVENETFTTNYERDRALNYLKSINADLVKGDLVIFDSMPDNNIAIYDGMNILNLYDKVDARGSLHPLFHVIENGVPITYWKHLNDTYFDKTIGDCSTGKFNTGYEIAGRCIASFGHGIKHNNIVWFNHCLVQQECLHNLVFGPVNESRYAVYTEFKFNDIKYTIIFNTVASAENTGVLYKPANMSLIWESLEKCENMLKESAPIMCSTSSESYTDSPVNTLFVTI